MLVRISSVLLSHSVFCLTLCDPMNHSTPGFPVLQYLLSLPKFMYIELVMLSNHLILCHPLLLLPSIFPSIGVFSSKSALWIRHPKYWSFNFSISPSNEYWWLISFDWFGLLVVQGTHKSLLQHHNSKASIPWCSTFYMVQLSPHPHISTGRNRALTIQILGKWCLCFLIRRLGLS